MRNRKLQFGCLLLLMCLVALGWWGSHKLRSAPAAVPRFELVERGEIVNKVTETGTLEPIKKVEVKSKAAGRINRLLVQEGSRVQGGQLLAEIDPTEVNSQVAQMQAQLDGARARLRSAERGVGFQATQTQVGVAQARATLRSAEERLRIARVEADAQPDRNRSDLAQAESTLQAAKDSLSLLETATQPQTRVQAQTGYDEAKTLAERAKRTLERNESLLVKGYVSEQTVEGVRSDLVSAVARRDQAQKRLEVLEKQQDLERADAKNRITQAEAALKRTQADRSKQTRQQEIVGAQSALSQAKAQLQNALATEIQTRMRGDDVTSAKAVVTQLENQLREVAIRQADTRLVAPMSGTVTQRYLEEGELVTSGTSAFSAGQSILQIADLSRMRVTMSVNEVDVQRIRVGLPVEIIVDGVRGVVFKGKVHKVAPASTGANAAAAPGPGRGVIRFAVEVLVTGEDARLRPGMSARSTILIDQKADVVRIPKGSLVGEGDATTVQVLTSRVKTDKSGKTTPEYETRKVQVGLRGDAFVEILSGLKAGEKIKPADFSGPARVGVMEQSK